MWTTTIDPYLVSGLMPIFGVTLAVGAVWRSGRRPKSGSNGREKVR
jgi:hypothetical protein